MHNIEVRDTSENIFITGELGEYFELEDNSIVTGNALLIQIYDKDSLFLHADLLRATTDSALSLQNKVESKTNSPSLKSKKKNPKESTVANSTASPIKKSGRVLLAYHKVKFFKSDMQGKCDSLVFSYKDSIMHLYTQPVIWSDKNQW